MLKPLILLSILIFLMNSVSREQNFPNGHRFHGGRRCHVDKYLIWNNNKRKEIVCVECPGYPPGLQPKERCGGFNVLDWMIDMECVICPKDSYSLSSCYPCSRCLHNLNEIETCTTEQNRQWGYAFIPSLS